MNILSVLWITYVFAIILTIWVMPDYENHFNFRINWRIIATYIIMFFALMGYTIYKYDT